MSYSLTTGGEGTVATAEVVWSVNGQTYKFRSDNNFLSWITTIFTVADVVAGNAPDYRLLRPYPATDATLQNVGAGANALAGNTIGLLNTAVGASALQSNTTGNGNTANGLSALRANTTGDYNTASGVNALLFNTTGNNNTASGVNALLSNTTGIYNTASGVNALYANTTGGNNVALGFQAGDIITSGSNNICIGSNADVNLGTRANCIAIGSGAVAQVDGEIAFASALATKTTIGANGGATALTALPVGYIRIRIGATAYQIPYYNV